MRKNTLILLGCLFIIISFISCFDGPEYRAKIIDQYYVYSEDGNVYKLTCKLSCDGDPTIENITNIGWDSKFMHIISKVDHQQVHYYIVAKRQKLACCNNDTLIGPFKDEDVSSVRVNYHIPDTFYNQKSFDQL